MFATIFPAAKLSCRYSLAAAHSPFLRVISSMIVSALACSPAVAADKIWFVEMKGQDLGYFTLTWGPSGFKWTTSLFSFILHPPEWDANLYSNQTQRYTNMSFDDWTNKAVVFGYGRRASKEVRMSSWQKEETKPFAGVEATRYTRFWSNKKKGVDRHEIVEEVWFTRDIDLPGRLWGPITSAFLKDGKRGFPVSFCETTTRGGRTRSWRPFTATNCTRQELKGEDLQVPKGYKIVANEMEVIAGTDAENQFPALVQPNSQH